MVLLSRGVFRVRGNISQQSPAKHCSMLMIAGKLLYITIYSKSIVDTIVFLTYILDLFRVCVCVCVCVCNVTIRLIHDLPSNNPV